MSACLDCKDMLRYSGAHDCEIRIRDACCSLRVSCSCSRMHLLAGLLIRRTLWSIANVLEGSHPNGRSCERTPTLLPRMLSGSRLVPDGWSGVPALLPQSYHA